jgi:signal transduction histidine kinase
MNNSDIKTRFVSSPVAILSVATVYAVAAKVSFLFTIPPGNITPIFPAAGLALAAVMIMRRDALIGVWLGSFAANTISFMDGSMPSVQTGLPNLLTGAFIGLGAMSGAAAGAFLVRHFCEDEYPLQSGRNVLILVTVGALGCCLISPTFGVLGLSLGGNIPWERFGYSWLTWWAGDAAGTLVAAPFFLAWQHRHPFPENAWRILEAAILGSTTILACFFVFFRNIPCEYGLLPLLLWAAFRFGMRGVTTTAAVIALLATVGTSRGSSPFSGGTGNESLLLMNSFFGVTITCALFLSGMMEERRRVEKQIQQLHEDLQQHATELERRVGERTAELAVAKDRAEAADRLKSAFLATMSHELRTPLNSIIGFTGIILQGLAGPLNPEQGKQLEMVSRSARHLLALINDVLDISKIEAGQLEVKCAPFDLRVSIEKAVSSVKLLTERKGLALRVKLAPEIGAWVSDERRVEQILINLLNNAIKFTEHGHITLAAVIERGTLRISVTDTGIGIKSGDFQKIFQPFRQIDTGLARNYEGTGLGLAICRRLAELLGGEICAESEWGKGSTFTVVLPVRSEDT